jgi:hypothetical protein
MLSSGIKNPRRDIILFARSGNIRDLKRELEYQKDISAFNNLALETAVEANQPFVVEFLISYKPPEEGILEKCMRYFSYSAKKIESIKIDGNFLKSLRRLVEIDRAQMVQAFMKHPFCQENSEVYMDLMKLCINKNNYSSFEMMYKKVALKEKELSDLILLSIQKKSETIFGLLLTLVTEPKSVLGLIISNLDFSDGPQNEKMASELWGYIGNNSYLFKENEFNLVLENISLPLAQAMLSQLPYCTFRIVLFSGALLKRWQTLMTPSIQQMCQSNDINSGSIKEKLVHQCVKAKAYTISHYFLGFQELTPEILSSKKHDNKLRLKVKNDFEKTLNSCIKNMDVELIIFLFSLDLFKPLIADLSMKKFFSSLCKSPLEDRTRIIWEAIKDVYVLSSPLKKNLAYELGYAYEDLFNNESWKDIISLLFGDLDKETLFFLFCGASFEDYDSVSCSSHWQGLCNSLEKLDRVDFVMKCLALDSAEDIFDPNFLEYTVEGLELIRHYMDKTSDIKNSWGNADFLRVNSDSYLDYFRYMIVACFQLSIPVVPAIRTHQEMKNFFNEYDNIIEPIEAINPDKTDREYANISETVFDENGYLHAISVSDYLEERKGSVVDINPILQRMISALYSQLLQHLKTIAEDGNKHPGIEFIENNFGELTCVDWPDIQGRDRYSHTNKIFQALYVFDDREDIFQIAVRAVNPYSVSDTKPYLFSSKENERMLALVYLEIEASSEEDKPNLMDGLIYALAEIQRANSMDPWPTFVHDSSGMSKLKLVFRDDEPACMEGTMIRIARILSNHPQYSDLYSQDRESLIIESVSRFIANKFKQELSLCGSSDEKSLLYHSLILMDPFNTEFRPSLKAEKAFGPLDIVITDAHTARRQAFIDKYFNDAALIEYVNTRLTITDKTSLKSGEFVNLLLSLLFQTGEPKILGPALANVYAECTAQDALKPTVKNPYIISGSVSITPLYQQKLAFKAMLFDKVYAEDKGVPDKLKRVIDEVVALIYQGGKPLPTTPKDQEDIILVVKSIYAYIQKERVAMTDNRLERVCKTALALPEPSIERLMSKLSSSVHSEQTRNAAAPVI